MPENLCFFGVFRGYKWKIGLNGLMTFTVLEGSFPNPFPFSYLFSKNCNQLKLGSIRNFIGHFLTIVKIVICVSANTFSILLQDLFNNSAYVWCT